MGQENDDFEKVLLEALNALKKEIASVGGKVNVLFNYMLDQAVSKGSECARVAELASGEKYCTEYPNKSIPEVVKKLYVVVGERYYPKPGGPQCFACVSFKKREPK